MSIHDFGRVADIYDATRSLPGDEMRLVMDSLASEIPRGGRVADLGVGTGRFSKPLLERGYEVVGIDISRGMMAKAKEKGIRELIFADAQHVPLRDACVDSVLLVHVLHLVRDWAAVVREAARVSRGNVLSVIETSDGNGREAVREEYRKLRVDAGYPLDRFEGAEGGLLERVPPERLVPVVESRRESRADDELDHLSERGQSLTWGVPDGEHARIVRELRERFGGKVLRSEVRIAVSVWSAESLRSEDLR